MSPRVQALASAQVWINRAVFQANKDTPDELSIDGCIASALSSLSQALEQDMRRRWRAKQFKRRRHESDKTE